MRVTPNVSDSLLKEVHRFILRFAPNAESVQTDLLDAGTLDSASLVQLLQAVESHFAVAFPKDRVGLNSLRTVASIADLVHECRRAKAVAASAEGGAVGPSQSREVPGLTWDAVDSARTPSQPEWDVLISELHGLFRNSLFIEVPSPETDLFHAGLLDSMALVHLILMLENHYGIRLSLEDVDVAAFSTTTGIARLLQNLPSRT